MSNNEQFVNGPILWDKILKAAPAGAVIAGGAVRDYVLGLPVKDIDVFVPKQIADTQIVPSSLTDPAFTYLPVPDDRKEEYEGKQFVAFVTDYRIGNLPVQIIDTLLPAGEDFAETLANGFDFGITRYWYDGAINWTWEAAVDAIDNVVKDRIGDRPERAAIRAARFIDRNPGRFTFIPFEPVQA